MIKSGLVMITTDLNRKYTIDLKDNGLWCVLETGYKSESLDECLEWLNWHEQNMLENYNIMYGEEV